ncbi:Uma2 family endonuclease [Acaryochloris sp. IP29b_bin.137]|uniref:Uma2 family endonuclease n=1 Tax=Acaryochloris sp. IP29b_bin.137 TaxID=2969217 RepID=UPI002635D39E|nr:Uma2 family endonuclease [Acaryochloris sp. IP29b_bin.137]
MTVQILRKKFTVGQYHQMIESGILTDRDHVELIQGEIIEMSPVGRHHAACVDRLNELLVLKLFQKALIRVQSPILLSDHSEPQPDVSILQRREDFYDAGHPKPDDIFALVEVSDSTIEFDRDVKIPMYAQEHIPEVWLVNLNDTQVKRYCQPITTTYQQLQIFNLGEMLSFQAFPDVPIEINQIFG